jgi:hypothetical protein
MKPIVEFICALLWLWACLFALGTFLLVLIFPVFLPLTLFLKWVWQ